MPKKKYLVKLTPEERETLEQLFTSGEASVQVGPRTHLAQSRRWLER